MGIMVNISLKRFPRDIIIAMGVVLIVVFSNDSLKVSDATLKTAMSKFVVDHSKQAMGSEESRLVGIVQTKKRLTDIPVSKHSPDPIYYCLKMNFATLLRVAISQGRMSPHRSHFVRCALSSSPACMDVLMSIGTKPDDEEIMRLQRYALLAGNETVAQFLVKEFGVADLRTVSGLRMPKELKTSILGKHFEIATWNELMKIAAASGDEQSLLVLCEQIDDTMKPRVHSQTLFYAVRSSSVPAVRVLLEYGATNEIVEGTLPSQLACLIGNPKLIDSLNFSGIDWSATDDLGRSCVHFAVIGGDSHVVRKILDLGVDPNLMAISEIEFPAIAFPFYMPGMSALHLAASLNNSDAIRILVSAGADIELETDNQFRETAMSVAKRFGSTEAVQILTSLKDDRGQQE